jgi:hypothetical protein
VSNTATELRKLHTLSKAVISLGCDAANDIVIDDPPISALHLQPVRKGEQWVLIHPHPTRTQTTNGLPFQGRQIRGDYTYHGTLFSTYSQTDAMQRILLAWIALGMMILAFGVAVGIALKWKDRHWQ